MRPGVASRRTRGEAHEGRIEIAHDLMRELDRRRDVDRLDIDLKQRNAADPGFVLDLDGVVAETDDEIGGAQQAALHLPAGALDAAERERMLLVDQVPSPWSWWRTANCNAR